MNIGVITGLVLQYWAVSGFLTKCFFWKCRAKNIFTSFILRSCQVLILEQVDGSGLASHCCFTYRLCHYDIKKIIIKKKKRKKKKMFRKRTGAEFSGISTYTPTSAVRGGITGGWSCFSRFPSRANVLLNFTLYFAFWICIGEV